MASVQGLQTPALAVFMLAAVSCTSGLKMSSEPISRFRWWLNVMWLQSHAGGEFHGQYSLKQADKRLEVQIISSDDWIAKEVFVRS